MSYTVILTITRPNEETEFDSPDPAMRELQIAVKADREAATGFISEKRRHQGDVLTVTRLFSLFNDDLEVLEVAVMPCEEMGLTVLRAEDGAGALELRATILRCSFSPPT